MAHNGYILAWSIDGSRVDKRMSLEYKQNDFARFSNAIEIRCDEKHAEVKTYIEGSRR